MEVAKGVGQSLRWLAVYGMSKDLNRGLSCRVYLLLFYYLALPVQILFLVAATVGEARVRTEH
jgi:hypothetical protein